MSNKNWTQELNTQFRKDETSVESSINNLLTSHPIGEQIRKLVEIFVFVADEGKKAGFPISTSNYLDKVIILKKPLEERKNLLDNLSTMCKFFEKYPPLSIVHPKNQDLIITRTKRIELIDIHFDYPVENKYLTHMKLILSFYQQQVYRLITERTCVFPWLIGSTGLDENMVLTTIDNYSWKRFKDIFIFNSKHFVSGRYNQAGFIYRKVLKRASEASSVNIDYIRNIFKKHMKLLMEKSQP